MCGTEKTPHTPTTMTNRAIQVLVVHEKDAAWPAVRSRMEALVAEGYLWPFLVLTVATRQEVSADPVVELIQSESTLESVSTKTTLLGYLASLGSIAGVTTVALRCDSAESPDSHVESVDIDAVMRRIEVLLVRFATEVDRRTVRMAVIGEEEKAPGAPFFAKDAGVNLIVLPRDVSMNRAVARPVLRDNHETFVAHAATEICSVLGLWTSMDMSPIDGVGNQPSGMPGYSVHLVCSRVKALLAPPLPVSELVDESGVLPLPRGFSPVDNLAVVVERYANVVFPENMKFMPLEKANKHVREPFWRLCRAYIREFWLTFTGFPSIVKRGFRGELESVGAVALDRLLGGAEGRIRPIIPGESGAAEEPITEELVENMIRDIEFRDGRPVVAGVTTEQWEELISGVLGIADGSTASQSDREMVMPANILVRDKSFLAPDQYTVSGMIRAVMPPNVRDVSGLTDPADEHGDEEDDTSGVEERSQMVSFVAPGDIDLEALREAVRRSGISRPEAPDNVLGGVDLVTEDSAIESDARRETLIGYLTQFFDREFTKSEESTIECLRELRQLPSRFRVTEVGKISKTVVFTFALALSVIIISLATHGPFRALLSIDWLSRRNRDYLWLSFSSLVLVIAIAALMSTGRRSWQSRTIVTSAVCAGLLATEYVIFDSVRDAILETGRGVVDASVAIAIFLVTTLVTTVAALRNWSSDDLIRRQVGRLLAIVLWCYVTLALSSYVAGPESFILGWADEDRHRLLIAAQFVAWISLLVSTGIVVTVRVQQQNNYGTLQADFSWAQDNLVHSVDARRHLRTAYTHWLILASALSRMFWHPLGREATERTAFDGSLTGDESILKFDLAEIQLTAEGRIALLAQLKQRFVRAGWLKVQFEIARSTYQSRRAFVTGDPIEDHDPVGCPSIPSIESLLADDAQGDRFDFAKFLLDGTADSRLLAGATNENLEDVYSTLMVDERMHTVVRAQNSFGTGFGFLADIVPDEPSVIPPRVLSALRVASDEQVNMTSHLWWPDVEIISKPKTDFVEWHRGVAMSTDRMNDSVVLMAVLVDVSGEFLNTEVRLVSDEPGTLDDVDEVDDVSSSLILQSVDGVDDDDE